ncbi:hypothetical protein ABT185_36930, partial [Streptomyces clavifer]
VVGEYGGDLVLRLHLHQTEDGVGSRARSTIGSMLWSDPENKPPKELRDAQDMMRRAGLLLALAMVVAMFVLGTR